jgi:hypothetical protein
MVLSGWVVTLRSIKLSLVKSAVLAVAGAAVATVAVAVAAVLAVTKFGYVRLVTGFVLKL